MKWPLHLLAAGLGALALLLGASWFFGHAGEVITVRRTPAWVHWQGEDYPPRDWGVPTVTPRSWINPSSPRPDGAWRYDVFTPPVIYYNRLTGRFTVTPPDYTAPRKETAVPAEPEFGLELIEVQAVPFRLQLVGYAGAEGTYLGMFEHGVTGETLLAREGRVIDDLDLRIVELVVRREEVAVPDSMPLTQTVARARVWDERSREEVRLSSLERRVTGQPLARLRLSATGEEQVAAVGAHLEVDRVVYTLERIERSPPSVEITRREGEVVLSYRLSPEGVREPLLRSP